MCGISFILDKNGLLDEHPIEKMVHAQLHRGPDASQFLRKNLRDQQVFLGASRLRISENTSSSDQPLFTNDNSCALLFNGEIYNCSDLKNELLQVNVHFHTHSDTEVLLNWLMHFGVDRIQELEGMFAFVFCDFKNGSLIVARDRFGMKPLYFYENGQFLICSSETRGIIASGLIKKDLNTNQIANYFNYKYPVPPETFYKEVYQLRPGSFMKFQNGKLGKPLLYFQAKYDSSSINSDEVRDDLVDSLYQQVSGTRGVGLMLSGGIDSSLLLTLAHREGIKIPCYSIFTKSTTKEQQLASYLTKKLIVDHRILYYDEKILESFSDYVLKLDQPISDSAGLLTWKISEFASNDIKVLLSGAGADELFGGYNRHRAFQYYLKNKKRSLFFKKYGFSKFGKVLPANVQLYFQGLEENEHTTAQNFIKSHLYELRKYFDTNYISEDFTGDHLKNLFIEDLTNYLPNDVLAISDQLSMGVGLEMRMPFLKNSMLEKINATDAGFLMAKGPKWILKEILGGFVPQNYIQQSKLGFGIPISHWLSGDKVNYLWSLFENKNSVIFNFLEREIFKHLLSQHKAKKGNHEQELWAILTLGYWLQNEFG